jgi:hypothetical protein
VTATLAADGEQSTKVTVLTDLNITGKPAQFGRGVMVDVGNKLIGQFADCLAGKLAGPEAAPAPEAEQAPPSEAEIAPAAAAESPAAATASPAAAVTEEPPLAQPTPAAAEIAAGEKPAAEMAAEAPSTEPAAERPSTDLAAGVQATADTTAPSVPAAGAHAAPSVSTGPRAVTPTHEVEPIDLLGSAGPAIAKRLAPVAVLLAVAAVVWLVLRRRR